MSALGTAGTVIFLLFGVGGLIFYVWYISTWGHDTLDYLLPWAIIFIIIGIVIGIADSKKKSSYEKWRDQTIQDRTERREVRPNNWDVDPTDVLEKEPYWDDEEQEWKDGSKK